ncbi:suppressor of fused domain protein [Mechercharimyces sp. CAU 1602]|uniref:suppressor of fused domain protein n=1 Tax=Mechercharimyces sp. CAU 1602 TaxID=2973933 RepID=UPI0021619714|nr:suppressor of fused domain protein [Mechercharimyces sp. CAU 1602]MCS1350226.1 suppressor of fused domain protein [Mechercharimyces sp. CAU 1602]
MGSYIDFLEVHLGEIEGGYTVDFEESHSCQVVKYKRGPIRGTEVYSTLGLSHHYLDSPVSKKKIRHELFFIVSNDFESQDTIPGILGQLAIEALENHIAYLAGDVIGPRGPLFTGTDLEALYISTPVYFPDSFGIYYGENDLPIIQAWVFPITANEALYVKQNGWGKFEDLLEKVNPDLVDFNRSSIVL